MQIPGHVAIGYITGKVLLTICQPEVTPVEYKGLLCLAAFTGFAVDLDVFVSFWKGRSLSFKPEANHRKYVTHTPLFWLALGLPFLFGPNDFIRYAGLLIFLCGLTHVLIDCVDYGVRLFWPLSSELYALRNVGIPLQVPPGSRGWRYWVGFFQAYALQYRASAAIEGGMVLLAILALLS